MRAGKEVRRCPHWVVKRIRYSIRFPVYFSSAFLPRNCSNTPHTSSSAFLTFLSLYISSVSPLFSALHTPAFIALISLQECLVASESMASTSDQSEIEITNAFDELAPPSASTSTSATSSLPFQKLPCDVFINHRGTDVKHTLATSIYKTLNTMGFRVFLDSEDLQLGDFFPAELQEVMSRASLHVAILSPTYAQSPWCLADLSFMLKTGTPIIPVFYQVQPDDLRHLDRGKGGIYANSFLKHQGRYSTDKLEDWKMALNDVSFYKGEIINNNGEEQMVLKNIMHRVSKLMKIEPLQPAKHPVGLEEAVADFEMSVRECAKSHSNVQIVGIWGMGGSGKTTLAKHIYNQKHTSVGRSSFIFDVRDAAAKGELHKKQIELLQNLGFNSEPFDSVEKGKGILSNWLKSAHVLIILDDVDHTDQLDALLPAKDSLRWGSLIVITTREKEVLIHWNISSIYKMKAMNPINAEKLFCWHTFLQPSPLLGFKELVAQFLNACDGLPLSLKVLGGQLYGCLRKDIWEEVLHKISKILPSDIINRLRISYDALDKEEKQMFLDVACFFIGKDQMTAIAVWEGSGWSGLYGLERLLNKCLIDLDDNNEIRMHDHLRDMGREIASTLSPYRLWSPDQSLHQFTAIEKQEERRGMIVDAATHAVPKFFGTLLNPSTLLSLLDGLKVFVVGAKCQNLLPIVILSRELAWLSCTRTAYKNLPLWMPLKNLRVLEIDHCMEGLWQDGAEAPLQLRVLNISHCSSFKFPKSIVYLENLKKISMYCCNFKSLPEEFCLLQSLEHLQLKECRILSQLPSSFGNLTNLRHVDLSEAGQLKLLPDSFKQLSLLQHLNLKKCWMLTLQSDILENMTRLEYLNLDGCSELEELPRHITNQACLSELHLRWTRLRELPINIGRLSKLRVMKIGSEKGCFQMQSLPDSMESVNLLEQLLLENLQVESLPKSLKQLINLQTLEIINCPISELDFGITSSLSNLREVHLKKTRVSKISISEDCCPGLKSLILIDNEHLREVDTLPTAIVNICVINCKLLRNLSAIGGVVNLRELIIRGCPELDTLPSFDKLASLVECELDGSNKVDIIQGLQECTSLECLFIDCKCWEVSGIESWERLQRLRLLQLGAKKRSAVQTCIQTIQKWPEQIVICTEAVTAAGSLLNSSTFPNLSVLHSFTKEKISHDSYSSLRWNEKHISNGNVILLCFVINCVSPPNAYTPRAAFTSYSLGFPYSTWVEEGKWILIGVFTQQNPFSPEWEFSLTKDSHWIEEIHDTCECEVEKGLVVSGDGESVVEAFHRLFALVAS